MTTQDAGIAAALRACASRDTSFRSDLDFGPVSEEQLQAVETSLGVKLPASYRSYLAAFAGGLLVGTEFFGVPTERSRFPAFVEASDEANIIMDLVAMNRSLATSYPRGYVVIGGDGGDFTYWLDTTRTTAGECPVLIFGPGSDGEVAAASFLEFVSKLERSHRDIGI
jgi:hypothetical protein